ncbi:hypothetical protein ERJ75_000295700 [Trypanosoma vivax]|nr:hypothetical protein ERJ75_000295700 [Trypanosoma vivax]
MCFEPQGPDTVSFRCELEGDEHCARSVRGTVGDSSRVRWHRATSNGQACWKALSVTGRRSSVYRWTITVSLLLSGVSERCLCAGPLGGAQEKNAKDLCEFAARVRKVERRTAKA